MRKVVKWDSHSANLDNLKPPKMLVSCEIDQLFCRAEIVRSSSWEDVKDGADDIKIHQEVL